MPPPLGAGGIMFSGCPSVRPKPEIPSFDLYMGPLVHPTNRDRFTACPSGEVSGHLPENAWREWPEILYADVSWPSTELIEPVSAFSPANNPGRANENPIWWRWHGNTKSHAILPSVDV